VRGLNDNARKDAVNELVRDTRATIVCLQETKLQLVDQHTVTRTIGAKFANSFTVLPAQQTRGGILLAVNEDFFDLSNILLSSHAVTATITMRADGLQWQITVVYGPQGDAQKLQFLQDLQNIPRPDHERWLILGDFNLIYQAEDKNNSNLNRQLMGSFKSTLDVLGLKEIRLNGRRFTWSNEQDAPTMTRIDRVFCTPEWELLFPTCYLHSLPSLMSDHTPLLLQGELDYRHAPSFKFENFWTAMQGFQETVHEAWNKEVFSALPLKRLHIKLSRTAKAINRWRKDKVGDTKLQLAIVKEILLQLEAAQEFRALSDQELQLRRQLKTRSIGLAAIEKARIRQKSRLTYIRCGDANTKYFHIRASSRRRKNYIHCLHTDEGMVFAHEDKEKVIQDYFSSHIGSPMPRQSSLDWHSLGYTPRDLSDLELPFTMEEVKSIIDSMPPDKAPGPDGFTGAFFKASWEIIKFDIMAALNSLYAMNSQSFHLLNSANIVLLPKKSDARKVTDYRPISLIHSIAKIFSKLLANRLANKLDSMVSNCQSAFIRKRSIHDNFLYVQNTVRKMHKLKMPALFLKLDIHKAFDTVNWSYLLEVMQALGFGQRWREWMSILFNTAKSAALLNGHRGPTFCHGRGVRQGDPLSPMLFILAMDPLQRLLDLATEHGVLSPLPPAAARWRISMYADDAAILPIRPEMIFKHSK
jgi:exonuclease III